MGKNRILPSSLTIERFKGYRKEFYNCETIYSWSDYKYNTILQIYVQITFTYLQDCRSIQDFWKQISMSEKKSCFEYLFCYTRLNINTFYKNTDIYILQIFTRLNINTLFNNTDIYIFQIYSRLHIYTLYKITHIYNIENIYKITNVSKVLNVYNVTTVYKITNVYKITDIHKITDISKNTYTKRLQIYTRLQIFDDYKRIQD